MGFFCFKFYAYFIGCALELYCCLLFFFWNFYMPFLPFLSSFSGLFQKSRTRNVIETTKNSTHTSILSMTKKISDILPCHWSSIPHTFNVFSLVRKVLVLLYQKILSWKIVPILQFTQWSKLSWDFSLNKIRLIQTCFRYQKKNSLLYNFLSCFITFLVPLFWTYLLSYFSSSTFPDY